MRMIIAAIMLGLVSVQGCASEPAPAPGPGRSNAPSAVPATSQAGSGTTNADILLSKIKADKKLLVATNMNLTEAEAAKFWPLYDSYQQELQQINQRLGRTIAEYADAYQKGPLPDTTAKHLLDEALAVDEAEVALKHTYAEKLTRELPETKVARYMQIETKIRSLLKFELARQIPLVH
ncbi:hypothetical protein W02_02080 [Nitrospira sp. KM1]|uniref:hypothetical protein n=1 Tax=Nitrospira sp. KM1 TaxID=1936990 RepID=UPI0013A77790|nr:hypothetical protein [Nitrospira sp. KM1]BCA53068.1 hypothetical protein W02_02080 [Nitrospira sp. KM1]